MLRVENIMQQSASAVQGNSTTARQQLTAYLASASGSGLVGGAGGAVVSNDPWTAGMSGFAAAFAGAGKKALDIRVANRIAEMLISQNPRILNRGVRMIASSNRLLSALRSADAAIARAGGEQAQLPQGF
jgi:hypothetical protein